MDAQLHSQCLKMLIAHLGKLSQGRILPVGTGSKWFNPLSSVQFL